jgi:hypothetical protein
MVKNILKFLIFNHGLLIVIGLFIYSLFNFPTWIQMLLGISTVGLLTRQYSQYLVIEKIKKESKDIKKINEILEQDQTRMGW